MMREACRGSSREKDDGLSDLGVHRARNIYSEL
jgi:hypothetical protein